MGSPSVRSGPVKRLGDGGECVGDMLLDLVRGDAETGRDRSEILVAEEIRQENLTRDFRQRGDRAGGSVNRRSADVGKTGRLPADPTLGGAAGWGRVCKYVYISVGAVP